MGSFFKALGGIATDLFTGQANSALSSLRGQAYNERNMALQNKYQKDMVDYVFQKNDPARAADRWRRAGIAPQAVFGNSPGGAGVASDASAPSSSNPDNDFRSFNFVRTLAERQAMDNEKAVADATVNKLNAEADKLRGDTKDQTVTKLLQQVELGRAEIAKQTEQIQKEILDIEKMYKDAEKQVDLSIKQQILFETLAKIDKLLADKEVSEQMKENLKSQKALIEAQTKTEGSKQHNLDSSTEFNKARTKTENELRASLKSNTISKTALNNASALLENARAVGAISENRIKKAEAALAELESAVATGERGFLRGENVASLKRLIDAISPLK